MVRSSVTVSKSEALLIILSSVAQPLWTIPIQTLLSRELCTQSVSHYATPSMRIIADTTQDFPEDQASR